MKAYERVLPERAERPADHLAPLRDYLDKTSRLTNEQIVWLERMKHFLPHEQAEAYDDRISDQISENVNVASAYLMLLAEEGRVATVAVGDERFLLEGFAYDPNDGGYCAGVTLPEGPALLPLRGSFDALELL